MFHQLLNVYLILNIHKARKVVKKFSLEEIRVRFGGNISVTTYFTETNTISNNVKTFILCELTLLYDRDLIIVF